MIRSISILLFSILFMFSIMPSVEAAYEPCTYGGKEYQHGETRDGYICQHGQWIPLN